MRNVAPTKTSLLALRDELKFAKLGRELLDQKRSILVAELLALVDEAAAYEKKVEESLAKAYGSLEQASMAMGKLKVSSLACAVEVESSIRLGKRKVMGVALPVVETEFSDRGPWFSPMDTSFWIDAAMKDFGEVLSQMGRLAELKVSIMRLAREVRKTIRKVNALEKIAIPELETTVHFIVERLEESDRDMFILMKLVKARLTRAAEAREGRQA